MKVVGSKADTLSIPKADALVTHVVLVAQNSLWTRVLERDLIAMDYQVVTMGAQQLVAREPKQLFAAGNHTIVIADYRELVSEELTSLPWSCDSCWRCRWRWRDPRRRLLGSSMPTTVGYSDRSVAPIWWLPFTIDTKRLIPLLRWCRPTSSRYLPRTYCWSRIAPSTKPCCRDSESTGSRRNIGS